ncbi:MAG: hypothetical protein LBV12_04020 [Puniceicoccales bacterium]|jgi:hypoxanthine phosphoribosyltransferase|nr:hypothetical protein [Puniceicoccales bacterium]
MISLKDLEAVNPIITLIASIIATCAVLAPPFWLLAREILERFGHISWNSISRSVKILHEKMKSAHYRPDYIICTGRSGAVIGAMLSARFRQPNIPIIVLTLSYSLGENKPGSLLLGKQRLDGINECIEFKGIRNVLVVTSDVMTGRSMELAIKLLELKDVQISATASIYINPNSTWNPTFTVHKYSGRLKFPWMMDTFDRTWNLDKNQQNS